MRFALLSLVLLLGACVAPRPPIEAPAPASEFELLFATDRKVESGQPIASRYGRERGEMSYGAARVGLPEGHRIGSFETPAWWQEKDQPDLEHDISLVELKSLEPDQLFGQLADAEEVLLFVHGYNMSFEEALRRSGQIAHDLQPRGAVLLFSWPSQASATLYTHDASNAEWAEPDLLVLLERLAAANPEAPIHLAAHSMGSKIVMDVLARLARERPAETRPRIGQVVFAAPDIDSDVLVATAPDLLLIAERVTIYASEQDLALAASKRLNGAPRAGELAARLPALEGLDVVDVSRVETDFSGHSYYSDSRLVLNDLHQLLTAGRPPTERFGLRPVETDGARYWRIAE
ncbi:MAG: alpha/beta hydrolase [Pseudomonadota bacterium]